MFALLAILLVFDPIKKWFTINWNWLGLLFIIIYGLFYTIDCIIKWFWLNYTVAGKIATIAAQARKRERERFGNELLEAKREAEITGNWYHFFALTKTKEDQTKSQNIIYLNMWLKRELDRPEFSDDIE